MAERLIRESDVIKLIDEWLDNYPLPRHVEKGLMSHEELLAYIAEAPTIEAKPVVHAHWKEWYPPKEFILTGEEKLYICSNCDAKYSDIENQRFCPWCGAQMDEFAGDINVGSKTDHIAGDSKKEPICGHPQESVKIPVISMEDVPKLAKEMEK